MKGLLAILAKPKGDKGEAPPEKEEAMPDAPDDSRDEYKSLMVDAAKAGDWDSFADAVCSYVDAK